MIDNLSIAIDAFQTFMSTGMMVKVFANGLGDLGSIPGRVIPKTQKNGTSCRLA